MSQGTRTSARGRAVGVLCALALTAFLPSCRDRVPGVPAAGGPTADVVVASFNFPESALLAEIYARALEAAGVPVRRELGLGPRELVRPALVQRLVDVVPEYLGTALASVAPAAEPAAADLGALHQRLAEALGPEGLRVLDPAEAQNQNGVVVTRRTAERYGLSTVSDLAAAAPRLTLGGPPECPQRPYCLVGLQGLYGLRFAGFVPFETEQQRATALDDGVVDVAVMFTTDGRLATGDLVLLGDDRGLQPNENVVPVVSAAAADRYGARLVDTLDAVSSRLTTNGLRFLNWRTSLGGKDVATEARGWLERQGLIPPPG